ncbi:MAG TPA: hypothetical protein VNS33_07670 [Bradyrhizobium sp.]|nr:hypothetical protein [Bradyrhizobium sp.]
MPEIEDVLADAQREIKTIGDNIASLKSSMEKDLAAVRRIAEDAPKSVLGSAEFKKDMEALSAGVLEKHDALARQVKAIEEKALKDAQDRMDQFEKKLNRGRLGGAGDEDAELKNAREFTRTASSLEREHRFF